VVEQNWPSRGPQTAAARRVRAGRRRERGAADARDAQVAEGRADAAVHDHAHREVAARIRPAARAAEAEVPEAAAGHPACREDGVVSESPAHVDRDHRTLARLGLRLGGAHERAAREQAHALELAAPASTAYSASTP
jgi:hypothetical protein